MAPLDADLADTEPSDAAVAPSPAPHEASSHRQILRSTSIIGGASVLNIVIGLLRSKVAAVLLGPAGVGYIGLLQSLLLTSTAIASLGLGYVGTQQIAEAAGRDDAASVATVRRALAFGALALALIGGGVFWLLREPLARHVVGDAARASDVGWISLALALSVAACSQTALLNGLRRIGDLARVNVLSSALATAIGVGVLLLLGEKGIVAYVLAAPIATYGLGQFYVARLKRAATSQPPLSKLGERWVSLVRRGSVFMLAGLAGTAAQLAVRALIERRLDPAALGHFQAASTISFTYISFVLAAMGTDYYPRLCAAIRDRLAVNRMANEQAEVALLLAGPVFLTMLGFAPWILHLLYSGQFAEAATVLRWQILGDILKVAGWPLGWIILAEGDGKTYFGLEAAAAALLVLLTFGLLPVMGLPGAGLPVLVVYALYFPAVCHQAHRRTGFRFSRKVITQFSLVCACAIAVFVAQGFSGPAAMVLAAASVGLLSVVAIKRLGPSLLPAEASLAAGIRSLVRRRD